MINLETPKKIRPLIDQAHQVARLAGRAVQHVCGPTARIDQTAEDPHQRGLAGAVGTKQSVDLAGVDLEGHAAQRFHGAESSVQIVDLQGRNCGDIPVRGVLRVEVYGGGRHAAQRKSVLAGTT